MRFAAAVLLAGACASVAAATGGARTTAGATLAFVSVGEDRVGTIMKNTKPDGIPDAHFRLTLDAPGETVVKMGLRSTDADGTPAFGQRWDTVYGGDWIMAVFRNDTLLNPLDSGVNDPLTGPVTYELYIQSVSEAGKPMVLTGNHYRVDVTFASGRGIAVGTTVGSSGSRILTPIAIADPVGPAPPSVAPPPATTPPAATTPAAPSTPASGSARKATVALRASRTTAAPGACIVLKAVVTGRPAGAKLVYEQLVKKAWKTVRPRACSARAARLTYRATLTSGAKVVARSKPLAITWKA